MDSNKGTIEEIAQMAMAVLGVYLLWRVWSLKIRPWIEGIVPSIKQGDELVLGPLTLDKVDLVALGILVVAMLLLVVLVRSSLKSRRQRREQQRESARV